MQNLSDIVTGGYQGARERARLNSAQGLDEVAKQFEGYFLGQMLKSMREASFGDPLFDSNSTKIYRDLLDDQLALGLAGGKGIGLADVLREQLRGLPGVDDASQTLGDNEERSSQGLVPRPAPSGASEKTSQFFEPPSRLSAPAERVEESTEATRLIPMRLDVAMERSHPKVGASKTEAASVNGENSEQGLIGKPESPVRRDLKGEALVTPLRFDSPTEFVNALMPHAQRAAAELGVPAPVLLAQSALETGWGKHVMQGPGGASSSHNLFGIKADSRWDGDRVTKRTVEYDGTVMKRVDAPFRAYASIGESFDDYVKFIKGNPRYRPVLESASGAAQYVNALQRAGYATDPHYAKKILTLMERAPIAGAGAQAAQAASSMKI